MTAEHLHLAINHLPILGLGLAVIPLVIGILTNSRMTILAGVILAMLGGWATPLVMETGDQAAERYEKAPLASYLDANVQKAIEVHEKRADAGAKVMILAAVLATICFGLIFLKPTWVKWVSLLLVVVCLASARAGIWIADAGGQIRRVDFRAGSQGK